MVCGPRMCSLPFMRASILAVCAVTFVGCAKQPAYIEVKGPADSLAAKHGVFELPVFEEENDSIKLRVSAFDDRKVYLGAAQATWKSLDPTVASVNQSGLVTILSSGSTKIVATTTETDPPLEASIDVKAVIIGDIKIVEPEVAEDEMPKLPMGETLKFVAEVHDDRGNVIEGAKVKWESTTYAAIIGVDGTVEGGAMGKTTIVATADNGESDSVEIEVTDWPKKRRRRR